MFDAISLETTWQQPANKIHINSQSDTIHMMLLESVGRSCTDWITSMRTLLYSTHMRYSITIKYSAKYLRHIIFTDFVDLLQMNSATICTHIAPVYKNYCSLRRSATLATPAEGEHRFCTSMVCVHVCTYVYVCTNNNTEHIVLRTQIICTNTI